LVGRRSLIAPALVLALSLARSLFAQEASVRAEVDATKVGVDDQVQLTITVEGRSAELAEEIVLPPLKNLRRAGGPFTQTQVSIVNGAMSQSRSYTYVLQPLAPGPAEIGAAHVKLTSGEKTTAPIAIEVVKGSVRPAPAQPANPFDEDFGEDPFASIFGSRRPQARAQPKLEVGAVASRTDVHVGEAVVVTYFLYTQTSVTGVQLAEAPQYPGFWAEDLQEPKGNPQGERTTLEGASYVRFPILRKLLFPTKTGKLTIPAATFRFSLPRVSFFDAGSSTVQRASTPLTVAVAPIPTDPRFSGAVGQFQVSASIDPATVGIGDAAMLRFQLSGTGNLKWVDRGPEVKIDGAKVYPPQTKSDLKVGAEGMKGSRTWEFVVVPETSGTLEVPSLPFAYFDPMAGAMKHVETAPILLTVPGTTQTARAGVSAPSSVAAPRVGQLALRATPDLPTRRLPVLGARGLMVGLALAVLAHGALFAAGWLSDHRRRGSGRSGSATSVRSALASLERARKGRLSKEEAASLIEKTLHDVFGPIENGAASTAGVREEAVQRLLQDVQFLRYAPQLGDYSEKIGEAADRAAELVRRWA
jgi:hypothetical protein